MAVSKFAAPPVGSTLNLNHATARFIERLGTYNESNNAAFPLFCMEHTTTYSILPQVYRELYTLYVFICNTCGAENQSTLHLPRRIMSGSISSLQYCRIICLQFPESQRVSISLNTSLGHLKKSTNYL